MREKKPAKALTMFFCMVFSIMLLLPQTALAVDNPAKLTLHYIHSDIEFSIYHVAEPSADGYALVGDFAKYPISFDAQTASEWKALASTLSSYVTRDGIAATAAGKTVNQTLVFSNLKAGMYLVIGEAYRMDDDTYTPLPFLAAVTENGSVSADVKYDKENHGNEYKDYTVEKIWRDDGQSHRRPESVTIQLLRDGRIYDTVILSERNQWKHVWKNLSTAYQWKIAEASVPEEYTVSITQDGTAFVVTNTLAGPESRPESSQPESKPESPKPPTDPDNPGTGEEGNAAPYIGVFASAALLMAGFVLLRKREEKSR